MKELCFYGCGQEATHIFKNGRYCCSDNTSKCPSMKKINSELNSGNMNGFFGKKHSEESKNKMSKSRREGKPIKEKKDRVSLKGRKHTEEARKKMSEAKKGKKRKPFTEETLEKMRLANSGSKNHNFGKSPSEETRKKIGEAHKGEKHWSFGKSPSEESRKKMSMSHKGQKPGITGKHHSIETKRKMRLSHIKVIENRLDNGGQISPNYNPYACKLIDEYGKENGYNFQHAENGGEFFIKELGYWLDGYDREKNIVIEIDEKHHFDIDGNLRNKDINRQKEIENFLKCQFIRIKYND